MILTDKLCLANVQIQLYWDIMMRRNITTFTPVSMRQDASQGVEITSSILGRLD